MRWLHAAARMPPVTPVLPGTPHPPELSTDSGATTGSIAGLVLAFKATLCSTLQTTLSHDHSLANAEGGGASSGANGGGNFGGASGSPTGAAGGFPSGEAGGGSKGPRLGIKRTDLGDSQMAAFTALLKASTGSAAGLGYAEILRHLNADDYLSAHGGAAIPAAPTFTSHFWARPPTLAPESSNSVVTTWLSPTPRRTEN